MWDVRQLGSPMARVQLGGGVWRIRWLTDPNLENKCSSSSSDVSHLATATMHAGAHVLRLDLNRLGSTGTVVLPHADELLIILFQVFSNEYEMNIIKFEIYVYCFY